MLDTFSDKLLAAHKATILENALSTEAYKTMVRRQPPCQPQYGARMRLAMYDVLLMSPHQSHATAKLQGLELPGAVSCPSFVSNGNHDHPNAITLLLSAYSLARLAMRKKLHVQLVPGLLSGNQVLSIGHMAPVPLLVLETAARQARNAYCRLGGKAQGNGPR